MVPIAAALYAAFRINWRAPGIEFRHLLKLGLVSAAIALAFVLPVLIPYYRVTHGAVVDYRGPGESQAFAAALADYIIPPTTHFLWGLQAGKLWRNGPNGLWQSEWQLYLGAVALFLAIAGVFHRRRRVVVALTAMALGCLLFSFGPGIYFTHPSPLSGSTNDVALSPILAPGRLLRQLPGFNNLRGWARLGFFVELSVGLLAAAGLVRLLDWIKERFHARATTQVEIVAIICGLAVLEVFPRPMDMSLVKPRPVDQWLSRQPGEFAFMEYPIPQHAYGGPAIYSTRLTGKRIIMGNAQNPPNLAFWGDLSAFPSPFVLDLLYGWGAKYVLVDENLYRAGVSFWNIYQTWSSLESSIKASPRLKELTVLDGVHVYEISRGPQGADGRELLANGSFEEGDAASLPGWETVGKPKVDRIGKHSYDGSVACVVTPRDFLVSQLVGVEAGQCYRLSIRQRSKSQKPAALRLQLNWKGEGKHDLSPSSVAFTDVPSAPQWQESSIIIRAPSGSRYAFVQAGAAKKEIWVDDCSLRKLADNCEAVLFVTPNPVSVPAGQFGQTAISWNTYSSLNGRVTVSVDGGAEELFGEGRLGLKMFDGIRPLARYRYRLYTGPETTAAETVEVSAVERTSTIVADPNPVPSGPSLGRTRISWTTEVASVVSLWRRADESDSEVYVSHDGGPEQLFARGGVGSADVDWIAAGSRYEFRLYTKNGGTRRLLAKVVVTR
jgi:hypothetical protein